jgi:hypothetical protein
LSLTQARAETLEALLGIAAGGTPSIEALGRIAAARGISLEALAGFVAGYLLGELSIRPALAAVIAADPALIALVVARAALAGKPKLNS